MADIQWCETASSSSCITDGEWNRMVTFIQHSACTDFTIYDDCTCGAAATARFKFGEYNDIEFDTDRAIMIDDDETYIGHGAGDGITTGTENTFLGKDAGTLITTGNDNVLLGFEAGNTTAVDIDECTFVGVKAGQANTQDGIVGVGYQALQANTGLRNTAVGWTALDAAVTGADNTALGYRALTTLTGGINNVAVGKDAGENVNTGNYNILIGVRSGENSNQDNCVAIGDFALQDNSSDEIVAIGSYTLDGNSGVQNTGVGFHVLDAGCTGGNNTALGHDVLTANLGGGFNTAIGSTAMIANTTGNFNTAVGESALETLTTGDNNVALGYEAAANSGIDINRCVFVGQQAGDANTQDEIVGVGYQALENNAGDFNTAVGYLALDAAVTGMSDTALGYMALSANTSGDANVAIGDNSLLFNTTGIWNTAVGSGAGSNTSAGLDCCVYLGTNAGADNTRNQSLFINCGSDAFPLIYGEFDTPAVSFGTGSAFFLQFTTSGDDSFIRGGDAANDDLWVFANSVDANPFITLTGAGNIHLATGTQFVQYGIYKAETTDTFSGYVEMDDDGGVRRRFMICET